jgi:hypothetical protein
MAPKKKKVDSDDDEEEEEVLSEDEVNSADEDEGEDEDEVNSADEDEGEDEDEDEGKNEDEEDIKFVGLTQGLKLNKPSALSASTTSLLPVQPKLNITSGSAAAPPPTASLTTATQVPSLSSFNISASSAPAPFKLNPTPAPAVGMLTTPSFSLTASKPMAAPAPTLTLSALKPSITISGTALQTQPSVPEQLAKVAEVKKPEPYSSDINVLLVKDEGERDDVFNARKHLANEVLKIKDPKFEPYLAVAIARLYTNIAFLGVKYPKNIEDLLSQVTQMINQSSK